MSPCVSASLSTVGGLAGERRAANSRTPVTSLAGAHAQPPVSSCEKGAHATCEPRGGKTHCGGPGASRQGFSGLDRSARSPEARGAWRHLGSKGSLPTYLLHPFEEAVGVVPGLHRLRSPLVLCYSLQNEIHYILNVFKNFLVSPRKIVNERWPQTVEL